MRVAYGRYGLPGWSLYVVKAEFKGGDMYDMDDAGYPRYKLKDDLWGAVAGTVFTKQPNGWYYGDNKEGTMLTRTLMQLFTHRFTPEFPLLQSPDDTR